MEPASGGRTTVLVVGMKLMDGVASQTAAPMRDANPAAGRSQRSLSVAYRVRDGGPKVDIIHLHAPNKEVENGQRQEQDPDEYLHGEGKSQMRLQEVPAEPEQADQSRAG